MVLKFGVGGVRNRGWSGSRSAEGGVGLEEGCEGPGKGGRSGGRSFGRTREVSGIRFLGGWWV